MAKRTDQHLSVFIKRSPVDPGLLDYTFTHVWWTGAHTDLPHGRKRHTRLLDEGSIVYAQPVTDVRVVLEHVTARINRHDTASPGVAPGRERSGVENVVGQIALPLELPPEPPEPTTA